MSKKQLEYLKTKAEALLKDIIHLQGEFYYEDDLKEIINGLNLLIIEGTEEEEFIPEHDEMYGLEED